MLSSKMLYPMLQLNTELNKMACLKAGITAIVVVALQGLYTPAAHATLPIESWKTQSGSTVMFMRTEALPMLDIQMSFAAGARSVPNGKEGLAGMTAGLIGKGATNLDENQISDGFADTGAVFGSAASQDNATASLRTLTTQPELSKSIELFKTVVQNPVFKQEVLSRELNRSLAAFKESLTKPATLADRAFYQALYPSHPYGRLATEQSLQSITVADLQSHYKTRYLAGNTVVSLVGNVDRAQAEKLANELTAGLPQGKVADAATSSVEYQALQAPLKANTIEIPHPAAQSHIQVGLPALRRGNPDYFKLLVANHVIGGGGFVSRLMKEIREDRGLAYSASSYFMPMGDPGPFQASVQTKKEQTNEALKVLNDTLRKFIDKGPTQAELDAAKSNLIGGFPLRIDSNSDLVANLTMMGLYGLPLNYLDTWTDEVAKVTLKDAKEAFARHVSADKLTTVVVGGQE